MNDVKFKSGDKVVFCKSSLESGMIDAREGDVFTIHDALRNRAIRLEELPGIWHELHFEHYVEKEKVMEKYIPKVGDKVRGFKFDSGIDGVGYDAEMDDYVDEAGVVVDVYTDSFVVLFPDSLEWMYPTSLAHLAKIEESSEEILHEDSQIDWQGSQINWQVGQEVFCLLRGKGVVVRAGDNDGAPYVVGVDFGYTFDNYTIDGKIYDDHKGRVLFFSEPKIIAETKPPKKPFMPVFKQGDTIIVKWADTTQVLILEKETERQVKGNDGEVWDKDPDVHFYKLGEQVKFS